MHSAPSPRKKSPIFFWGEGVDVHGLRVPQCRESPTGQAGWWSESCSVIGYPSRQDGASLTVRDYPICPARKAAPVASQASPNNFSPTAPPAKRSEKCFGDQNVSGSKPLRAKQVNPLICIFPYISTSKLSRSLTADGGQTLGGCGLQRKHLFHF